MNDETAPVPILRQAPPSALEPGATIDRYELVELVGRGGMGEVWEAVDTTADERVALKLIRESGASEALRRRFAREVRAASKVQHPSVVKVFDVIETDGGDPVMVMELLDGESLAERLDRDPEPDVEVVADILLPVISAVGSAHAHGIVHRDLKPENIFLLREDDEGSGVRVLDFGIAKLVAEEERGETAAGLTTTGSIIGTPCYMAPEQVFGEKDVDHRVDIWSLGILLYQMLSGILPTQADNVGQVLKIIVTRGIWPLKEAAPELPEDLTEMVERMLATDKDERPSDLREVQALLERYASGEAPSFGPPVSERLSVRDVDPLADTATVLPSVDRAEEVAARAVDEDAASPTASPKEAPSRARIAAVLALVAFSGVVGWTLASPSAESELAETEPAEAASVETATASMSATSPPAPNPPPELSAEPAPSPSVEPSASNAPPRIATPRPVARPTPPPPTSEPIPSAAPPPPQPTALPGSVVDELPAGLR